MHTCANGLLTYSALGSVTRDGCLYMFLSHLIKATSACAIIVISVVKRWWGSLCNMIYTLHVRVCVSSCILHNVEFESNVLCMLYVPCLCCMGLNSILGY